jgi:hypothetical protein
MNKNFHFLIMASVMLPLIIFVACKKNSNNNVAITSANIAKTYKLTGLIWLHAGISVNVYDSLPACEQDNLIKLNPDFTSNLVDAGIVCNPPLDGSGTWHLSADTLYFDSTASKIKSFDGKTLVLTGYPSANGVSDSTTLATTTLTKQ